MIRQDHVMAKDPRAALTPQLAIGIFIMLIGVLLTLDRLDIVDTARAVRFWPLAFIAVGSALLVQRSDPHGRFWGFVWLIVGSWLQLNTLGIVRIGFWDLFWPLLLIVIGLNLIRQTLAPGRRWRPGAAAPATSGNLFAVMSESKRAVVNEPFTGATMSAIMGGCILDLRQAMLAPGQEAVVDVFGLMAGHEIVVPSGWNVVTDVVQVLAGIEDKRLPPVGVPPLSEGSQPKLVLRGFLLLAGVTIKT
jgi:hypothetical protein